MYRGKNIFRCTQCGKIFLAPDFEYAATTYSGSTTLQTLWKYKDVAYLSYTVQIDL